MAIYKNILQPSKWFNIEIHENKQDIDGNEVTRKIGVPI